MWAEPTVLYFFSMTAGTAAGAAGAAIAGAVFVFSAFALEVDEDFAAAFRAAACECFCLKRFGAFGAGIFVHVVILLLDSGLFVFRWDRPGCRVLAVADLDLGARFEVIGGDVEAEHARVVGGEFVEARGDLVASSWDYDALCCSWYFVRVCFGGAY